MKYIEYNNAVVVITGKGLEMENDNFDDSYITVLGLNIICSFFYISFSYNLWATYMVLESLYLFI